jgi:hypothetical protein
VVEPIGAGGHGDAELRREAAQRRLRHAEGTQTGVAERDVEPGIGSRAGRVRRVTQYRDRSTQQLLRAGLVVDVQQREHA